MANRPSFQFYPADWRNNAKLRRCSEAARGAWVDVMCVLHDSDEYGVVRWPLVDLARSAGVPLRLVKELATKDVLKGSDKAAQNYVWAPKHAGKAGDPVVLVVAGEGPCWYCSRFVRDEYVRMRRGASTRFVEGEGNPKHTPKVAPKTTPNGTPKGGFGDESGDGASSSSSSSELGNASRSVRTEEGASASARTLVEICLALKKMGMADIYPEREELATIVERGFPVGLVALTAAEIALKKAHMLGDDDLHPELLQLFASGATREQMLLTPEQHLRLRSSVPNLGYLLGTLVGRAKDAASKITRRTTNTQPAANQSFEDKDYVGTDFDDMSPELRAAAERYL